MQLLADESYENGKHTGLGWINGEIKKLPSEEIKLPHMGWNNINVLKENKLVNYQKNDGTSKSRVRRKTAQQQ